jgi:hypothetical protein
MIAVASVVHHGQEIDQALQLGAAADESDGILAQYG